MDHIEHAVALAGAEVVGVQPGGRSGLFHRLDMAERQIHHVDIVAHARAVRGVIVVAIDAQARQLADGNLGDVGHQVIGDAVWILADAAAHITRRMRANRVEVAQQDDAPAVVRTVEVAEDLLDHQLGAAIGIGHAADGHILLERGDIVHSVHGGGGAEDDLFTAVVAHGLEQGDGAADVVVEVLERLDDALAHGLEPGEVDDTVDLLRLEDVVQTIAVADIALIEFELLAAELLNPAQGLALAVVEVVEDDDVISGIHQLNARVGTDVTGAACYENGHVKTPL